MRPPRSRPIVAFRSAKGRPHGVFALRGFVRSCRIGPRMIARWNILILRRQRSSRSERRHCVIRQRGAIRPARGPLSPFAPRKGVRMAFFALRAFVHSCRIGPRMIARWNILVLRLASALSRSERRHRAIRRRGAIRPARGPLSPFAPRKLRSFCGAKGDSESTKTASSSNTNTLFAPVFRHSSITRRCDL